jgi:membrane protease YdiL (CAAX protease family)
MENDSPGIEPPESSEAANEESPSQTQRLAFRDVPWTWRDLLIGLTPLVVMRVLNGWATVRGSSPAVSLLVFVLNCLLMIWMIGYPVWIVHRMHARLYWPSLRRVVLEAAIALPTIFMVWVGLFAILTVWAAVAPGQSPSNPLLPAARAGAWKYVILFTAFASICAPLSEEVFFRGLVYNFLRIRMPWVAAAIIQAIAFGMMHNYGAANATGAGLLGFALAVVYEWRRTLLTPMFVHFLQNLSVGLLTLIVALNAANAPLLGIQGDERQDGCLLKEVEPGSAAAEAGLQANDVLTSMEGYSVRKVSDIAAILSSKHAGDKIWVEYVRDQQTHRVEVTLKPR